jgi:hypothetical protein
MVTIVSTTHLHPAGGSPHKRPYSRFWGGLLAGWPAGVFYPFGHHTPYAYEINQTFDGEKRRPYYYGLKCVHFGKKKLIALRCKVGALAGPKDSLLTLGEAIDPLPPMKHGPD